MRKRTRGIAISLVLGSAHVGLAQMTFTAELDGRQTVPPAPTTATGVCTGTLNAQQTEFTFSCTHTAPSSNEGHLHNAPRGSSGDVVFEFAEADCCPPSSTWLLTAQEVEKLLAGEIYVNIHSDQFTSEEIRGWFDADGEIQIESQPFQGLCGAAFASAMILIALGLGGLKVHGRLRTR